MANKKKFENRTNCIFGLEDSYLEFLHLEAKADHDCNSLADYINKMLLSVNGKKYKKFLESKIDQKIGD